MSDENKSSAEMPGQARNRSEGGSCVHFTGIWPDKQCRAGIRYESVRVDVPAEQVAMGAPRFLLPCLQWHHVESACASCQFPTAEEQAAREAEIQRVALVALGDLVEGRCIECHQPITKRYKLGVCTYAEPCHHRQGR